MVPASAVFPYTIFFADTNCRVSNKAVKHLNLLPM